MPRRKRIAKRTASLLLCVVLLSLCFAPAVLADPTPAEPSMGDIDRLTQEMLEGLASLSQEEVSIIFKYMDISAGYGAYRQKIESGNYSGEELRRLEEDAEYLLMALSAAPALAPGGGSTLPPGWQVIPGGAAGAAGRAAFSPAALSWLKGGFAVGGVVLFLTDWPRKIEERMVLEQAAHMGDMSIFREWEEQNFYNTGNFFYNWCANDNWLVNLLMQIDDVEHVNPAHKAQRYWELTKSGWETINNGFRNLFYGVADSLPPGPQELPALNMLQALDFMNCVYFGNVNGLEIYHAPPGTIYRDKYGRYVTCYAEIIDGKWSVVIKSLFAETYQNMVNGVLRDGSGIHSVVDAGAQPVLRLTLSRSTGFPNDYDVFIVPVATYEGGKWLQYFPTTMPAQSSELGLPSTPYINNIDAIKEQLDRLEDKVDNIVIEFPHLENPTGDMYIDFYDWSKLLPEWDPFANVNTNPDPGTDPDPGTNPNPDPDPDDETDPDPDDPPDLPNSPDVTRKFPFCVPFDLIACLTLLNAQAEAPRFEIPLELPAIGFRYDFVIDFSEFELLAQIVRWFMLAIFVVGLVMMTRNMIRG